MKACALSVLSKQPVVLTVMTIPFVNLGGEVNPYDLDGALAGTP